MVTVTIPKKEYKELIDKKQRYDYLKQILEGEIFAAPPTKNSKEVVGSFKAIKKYNNKFLSSLSTGLKRSSHFK